MMRRAFVQIYVLSKTNLRPVFPSISNKCLTTMNGKSVICKKIYYMYFRVGSEIRDNKVVRPRPKVLPFIGQLPVNLDKSFALL